MAVKKVSVLTGGGDFSGLNAVSHAGLKNELIYENHHT